MKLTLETPIKMRILFETTEEYTRLYEALTYKNTSVAYQIKMTWESADKYGRDWAANRVQQLEQELKQTLIFQDEQGYYTRPGLLNFIKTRFECEIENKIVYPEFKLFPWHKMPEFDPHKAQAEAVEKMLANPQCHIEFATGTGKSFIIQLLTKAAGLPTIICTPSKGLARSMYEECQYLFGKGKVGLLGDTKREIGRHILVCIGKSLSMITDPEELEAMKKYQVFVSDESHTLPADQLDRASHEVVGHCPYRWSVSGTQERTDGSDLKLLSMIGPQVYNYTIQQAIEDGVLAKLSFLVFDVNSGNFFESNNLVRMNQEHIYKNEKIAQVIASLVEQAVLAGMPTLVLIDEHIQEEILKAYMKVEYTYACGKTKTHKICKDFNDGKIMCIVGNSAVSTGTNFKPLRLTINWQAGKSGVKVKQGPIGRSTRIDKKTGKTDCKVIDFRITNAPTLKRHTNERIRYYSEVGKVEYVNFDEVFQQMTTTRSANGT